jgi:hypothetical protein
VTAGCIDTDPPVSRRAFGQSHKPQIEIAYVPQAMWVTFTVTRCEEGEMGPKEPPRWSVRLPHGRLRGFPDSYLTAFSEVRIVQVQHLWASRYQTGAICCLSSDVLLARE